MGVFCVGWCVSGGWSVCGLINGWVFVWVDGRVFLCGYMGGCLCLCLGLISMFEMSNPFPQIYFVEIPSLLSNKLLSRRPRTPRWDFSHDRASHHLLPWQVWRIQNLWGDYWPAWTCLSRQEYASRCKPTIKWGSILFLSISFWSFRSLVLQLEDCNLYRAHFATCNEVFTNSTSLLLKRFILQSLSVLESLFSFSPLYSLQK